MKLTTLYSFLNNDIDLIEKELEKTVHSDYPLLSEASLHLLQAGGKRIRPVFVLLCGMFGEYDINKIKNVAVSLELMHMASLVHDDVIDDAELRRGQPTIKAKWDNRIAMYTGDYLFARSLESMTKISEPKAHEILSQALVEVCLGEIEQIKDKYNMEQNLRTYLRRIKRKTALLIAASCQLGAIAAGAGEKVHKTLYWFGYYVGMSYQIIDDILDFTASEEELGKPVGGDLLQGNVTLPVLYALKSPELKARLKLINSETTPEQIKPVIEELKKTDAIEQSFKVSEMYLNKAFRLLETLPKNRARTALGQIAKYIGKRKF
ncbi:heptaprenyl diphosphate synthase component II [Bacillus swezeyi]|uniref:Heptaprenyl diphosphate synthase component 2 n=1 Tax=Bacillus swezeyi TaxID=1925020 RepID=A0A1R1QFT1_9BACI|nr:heptaprenyl diphosphate synthase component II [Bacillus swezeyi]MEC1260527.1 heptaprenyl diphosphate synthase component II [Bacillus swezeyi]MED2929630.1 heptaprenyl diphosphate synthase component II [Bacillus swezeyi]MED2963343.1 heptaprenyl diphosphate synthase component II [Bacillus swezeyi]MED3073294.1 heptaprenyl diphosphate synthase component II [Bacillus swezeyi]MED3084021.1 heptaprenyl diphosphate synthase component II [Bacillus swezeyi]